MNWVIGGTLAYVAAIAFICHLFRHATDPEPCYVDPELAAAVRQALVAEVERQERLASTSELQAIDIRLYDPVTDEELAEFEEDFR